MDAHLGVGADGRLEAGGRVEREQLAVVHDRDPVAELVGFLHVVRRQQDRLTAARAARAMTSHSASRLCGSRPAVGSSRNEHVGVVHDRPRDHQPLRHAARELVDFGPGAVGEAELLEQLVGRARALRGALMPK